jgi:DNA-binding LacI/PurR family transcriptional regulator
VNRESDVSAWVTAADVARRAGVSRSAVSRTFTPGASVSKKTRERVLAAAADLDYRVNMLARSVIQQQSNLIGVVVSGFDSPFIPLIVGPLMRFLAERSLAPLLMDSGSPADMKESLQRLLHYRVAAAILTSGSPPLDLAREYARLRIPVALINRGTRLEGVDVVTSDNWRGGAIAAECLIRSGARRLAYVNRPTGTYAGRARSAGFCRAVAAARLTNVRLELIEADDAGYEGGAGAARRLFDRPPELRPDGVFCSTDVTAFGLLDTARYEFSLRVPADLQVVGFDDIPMAAASSYDLTTIRQDTSRLAFEAVKRLAERIADPDLSPRSRKIPVTLVERGTTARKRA